MNGSEERTALAEQLAAGLEELEAKKSQKKVLEERLAESERELAAAVVRGEDSHRNWLRAEQLAERANRELERLEDRFDKVILLIQDGAKALALLNSAAVAAMLALTQAAVGAGSWPRLKIFVLCALSSFLFGAVAASMMALPLARVMVRSAGRNTTSIRASAAAFWVTWLPIVAIAAFFLGAAALVFGLWRRL